MLVQIPLNGFPVDQEMDVAVDFVAPARPGRYISYWRLASPSGQKFGQRVWVHIQVSILTIPLTFYAGCIIWCCHLNPICIHRWKIHLLSVTTGVLL